MTSRRVATVVSVALFVIAGSIQLLLEAAYDFRVGSVSRHAAETYAVWFVLLGIIVAALKHRDVTEVAGAPALQWVVLVGCVLGALVLYWPIRNVGFLSDDFVLIANAASGDVLHANPTYFRPVPLAVWSAFLRLGFGPTAIHVLNIVLHGINAFLAGRVAVTWVPGRWPLAVSILFLTMPLAVEPVAWCSGIFDVMSVTCILTAVLLFRPGPWPVYRSAGFVVACGAALLSKETAIVLPALLLLDAMAGRFVTARSVWKIAAVAILFGAFALWRLDAAVNQPFGVPSKYVLQRALFSAVGSLANPWHAKTVATYPSLPFVGTAIAVLCFGLFVVTERRRRAMMRAWGAIGWLLLPCVPVLFFLPVEADLQGSRYLYMSAVGWSLFIAVCASSVPSIGHRRRWTWAVVSLSVVLCAAAVRMQLQPWIEAGRLRTSVLAAVGSDSRVAHCDSFSVAGLPDNVDGAYVFRSGFSPATNGTLGRAVDMTNPAPGCRFRWDATTLSLTQ